MSFFQDVISDVVPSIYASAMGMSRDQMILILSAINVDQLKIDLAEKNLVNLIFFFRFLKIRPAEKIVCHIAREKSIFFSLEKMHLFLRVEFWEIRF